MKSIFRRLIASILEHQVRRLLEKGRPLIVAVTGSVGKTSTKIAIAKVLEAKYRVQYHKGNFNSELGLPLAIFAQDLPKILYNPIAWARIILNNQALVRTGLKYNAMVLEMGADRPGEISHFMSYIHPYIGVITEIANVHTEQFIDIDGVRREKFALAKGAKRVALNADSPAITEHLDEIGPKPIGTFGLENGDYRIADITPSGSGLSGSLLVKGKAYPFSSNIIGRHNLYALAAAAAVADMVGIPLEKVATQFASIYPVKGRMNPLSGKSHSQIIDDSYNSSPSSCVSALETLKTYPGRKIAILGSMNELGEYAPAGHKLVGENCQGLDLVVTIGELAEKYLAPNVPAGVKVISFLSPYEAGDYVSGILTPGDTVLVKGSQNRVFAEEAVALLLADPKDREKLVRQSAQWQKLKHKQFGSKAS